MEIRMTTYRFRRAGEKDLPEIAALFARSNYGMKKLEWLTWKYLENPDGTALIYVAEDAEGRIICVNNRLPRRFRSKRTGEFVTFQNLDLFTAPEHRRKGVFARVGALAKSERDYFLIGFPNELSRKVTELDHIIPLYDWVFPVAWPSAGARTAPGFLVPLAAVLGKMYALFWLGPLPKDLVMKPVTSFERDFEIDSDMIQGVRSAAYLNWRFIKNPIHRYSAFEFIDKNESIGYCVYALSKSGGADVFDLVCTKRQRACIRLLAEHCRAHNVPHLNFRGANLKLWRFGFFCRRSSEDCLVTDIPNGPRVPEGRWLITLADRDV